MARSSLEKMSFGKARRTTGKDQHLCHLGPSPLLILALGSPGFAELPQQFMLPWRGGLGVPEGARRAAKALDL